MTEKHQVITNNFFTQEEEVAASVFRDILREEDLAVINISKRGESNFKRARGTLTQIADIAAPAEVLPRLDQCRVLVRTGIRLQAVRSMHKDDHCSVIAVVLVFPRREKEREKSRHGA